MAISSSTKLPPRHATQVTFERPAHAAACLALYGTASATALGGCLQARDPLCLSLCLSLCLPQCLPHCVSPYLLASLCLPLCAFPTVCLAYTCLFLTPYPLSLPHRRVSCGTTVCLAYTYLFLTP